MGILYKGKRAMALGLCVVTALSLTACGSRNKENAGDSQIAAKEYVYVPEYITLEDSDSNANYSNMQLAGDSLYYMCYQWDEDTGDSTVKFSRYSMTDGTTTEMPISIDGNGSGINGFYVDDEGSLYTVEYSWNATEGEDAYSQQMTYLCKYDAQSSQLFQQDISDVMNEDENNSYVNSMAVDAEGRFYLVSDTLVRLFDSEGNYQGQVSLNDTWIQGIVRDKNGKIYVSYYSNTGSGCELAELDFEGKSLGETYQNFPSGNSGNGGLIPGLEGDFLVNDGEKVQEYSLETQEATELFNWLDSDINGMYVDYVGVADNGQLLAVIRDWDTGETEIAKLTRTKSSELAQKTQLTIGTLYNSQSLQAAAVKFNKQSDTYHVNIKTYVDQSNWTETSWSDGIASLNNDIVSVSNCPDILALSSLDVDQLAAKGVFEDLLPYLEKSSVLQKDDFFQNVLDSYTFDGKLVCIPSSVSLSTVVGRTSELGDRRGWTLDELMAYADEHPEAELFDGITKSGMLYSLLNYNINDFIDWETGQCSFDSEEFRKILEFVNTFPEEYDWESDTRSTPVKIQSGEVLLDFAGIYDYNSIQEYEAIYGEPVTFIGYPNSAGNSGTYMNADELYAIASKSANKEGAWDFIEQYIQKSTDSMFTWGFPTRRSILEEKIAEATKVEYQKDESGEPILDEEGNPIPEDGTSSVGYGDWEYTYHIPTEAEMDTLRQLIESAAPVGTGNDEIAQIITEEAEAFFQGQKTAADVAGIIQSRVQIYVSENR